MSVVIGELEVRPAPAPAGSVDQGAGGETAGASAPAGLGPTEVTALADRAARRREERRSRTEVY